MATRGHGTPDPKPLTGPNSGLRSTGSGLSVKMDQFLGGRSRPLDFIQKPRAEAKLLFFVGPKAVADIRFCFGRDDERSAHSERIRRLTSAQGEPASGLARYAARRLRRSSSVSSERSIRSGHSATLSQISAAS